MRAEKKVRKIDTAVLDDFQPKAKQDPTTLDCLPCCIFVMLEYLNKKVDIHELKKSWSVDKYGYEPFEVLDTLATYGYVAEIGFYDTDYLGKLQSTGLNLTQVREIAIARQITNPSLSEGLAGIIRLIDNHPDILKVAPVSEKNLLRWLKRGYTVGVAVGLAEFTETDDESFHALIVYGLKQDKICLWDPVVGHLEGPLTHFIRAWQAGGGLYYVLK